LQRRNENASHIAKRAETRPCPVCEELIPLRLLPVHLDLELQRVEEIVKAVGSYEVLHDEAEAGYVLKILLSNNYLI
jgi:hypothetical protein